MIARLNMLSRYVFAILTLLLCTLALSAHAQTQVDIPEDPPPLVDSAQVIGISAPPNPAPGQQITVVVTMRNSGTSTWNVNRYLLSSLNPVFDPSGGSPIITANVNVEPGQQFIYGVNLIAPTSGTHLAQFQMTRVYGNDSARSSIIIEQPGKVLFGEVASVSVSVGATTPPPAPGVETVTYIHTDGLGSPVARTDSAGALISRSSYEPYGRTATGTTPTIGFTGHVNDADTGLVYMQQRYYDPVSGRFLSVDPVTTDANTGSSFNRYAYASNSPYTYIDADGRNEEMAYGAGVAFAGLSPAQQAIWAAGERAATTQGSGALQGFAAGNAIKQYISAPTITASGVASIIATALVAKISHGGATKAAVARDTLSHSLAPLKGKAPATVTGGYNVKTGEVAARACGGGKCAEDHVVDALGGNKADVRFTEAVRPRTGEQVPVCPRCEGTYGREPFPPGTQFKSDENK